MAPPVRSGVSLIGLRAAIALAAIAALIILTGLGPDTLRYILLGALVLAALITAPERRRDGGGWWVLFALGAALSVLGALVALGSETLGGLIAVIGGVLVVVGAAIGFPAREAAEP